MKHNKIDNFFSNFNGVLCLFCFDYFIDSTVVTDNVRESRGYALNEIFF